MADTTVATAARLNGVALVNIGENLRVAFDNGRRLRGARTLDEPDAIAAFLRDPANFPLFAKPAAGKYSLNVISADAYDPASDELILFGGARQPVPATAQTMAEGTGYVGSVNLMNNKRNEPSN